MSKKFQSKPRTNNLNPVFHFQNQEEDSKQLSKALIKNARKTGQLNLSGHGIATVPNKVWDLDDFEDGEVEVRLDIDRSQDEDAWWNQKPLQNLDLSSNRIASIPCDIKRLQNLTILDLHDNSLTNLPDEFGLIKNLTKLNLSHNKLTDLPDSFYKLIELKVLNISYNELETVTASVGDFIMLEKLDMSHNKLTMLPPGIGFLIRLIHLNLSYNKLTEIPPDVVNLRVLLKLDLTENELTALPPMGELRRLELLYAQHNNIKEMPDFFGCTALKEIYLGNNYINELSSEFCEILPHLKILDLRDNKIDQIPDEISLLQHLVRLDLTNNSISKLPTSLGLLPHLQNLQVEGNTLKVLRRDVIQRGTAHLLKFLREMALENMETPEKCDKIIGIDSSENNFPDKFQMKGTKSLNITMQEITNVPDSVFEDAFNAEVTIVDLCKNKLTQIPPGIKIIANNIRELTLSCNLLTALSEYLTECIHLQYLDVSKNMLTDIPDNFSSMKQLRELVISYNRFMDIPKCVYKMDGLEILLARDNKIETVLASPDGLCNLKRLAVLDLSNNNIKIIPPELGTIKLRTIELWGNSFRQPSHTILSKGTDSILSYLRDKIPQ